MTSDYILLPLEPLSDLKIIDVVVLSELAFMKKAFKDLYPSNAYLSSKLSISSRTVQRSLNNLTDYNYIKIDLKNNNKRIISLTKKTLSLYGLLYTQNNKKMQPDGRKSGLLAFWNSFN